MIYVLHSLAQTVEPDTTSRYLAVSNQYSYAQNFKVLTSGQIRKIRLICIFHINGLEVFL